MRGAVMHAPGDIQVESRPDPQIIEPTDAIIRVSAAGNDSAQTPNERTGDTTYAFPAHLLGELDAPAVEGVAARVSAAPGPPSRSAVLFEIRGP